MRDFLTVIEDVRAERERQEQRCADKAAEGFIWRSCADPLMADGDKLAVLMEEVGEVARELCEARAADEPPLPNLRTELIQVAAVAVAWAEAL